MRALGVAWRLPTLMDMWEDAVPWGQMAITALKVRVFVFMCMRECRPLDRRFNAWLRLRAAGTLAAFDSRQVAACPLSACNPPRHPPRHPPARRTSTSAPARSTSCVTARWSSSMSQLDESSPSAATRCALNPPHATSIPWPPGWQALRRPKPAREPLPQIPHLPPHLSTLMPGPDNRIPPLHPILTPPAVRHPPGHRGQGGRRGEARGARHGQYHLPGAAAAQPRLGPRLHLQSYQHVRSGLLSAVAGRRSQLLLHPKTPQTLHADSKLKSF